MSDNTCSICKAGQVLGNLQHGRAREHPPLMFEKRDQVLLDNGEALRSQRTQHVRLDIDADTVDAGFPENLQELAAPASEIEKRCIARKLPIDVIEIDPLLRGDRTRVVENGLEQCVPRVRGQ